MKFSLSKKLLLSNSLFVIPLIALMYLMVKSMTAAIDFGALEQKGNIFQASLQSLLQETSRYRILGAVSASTDNGSKIKESIDRKFKDLEKITQLYGDELQYDLDGLKKRKREGLEYKNLQNKWGQWKALGADSNQAQFDELALSLITDIKGLITHIGDTSNLILDPDLDSYYLMDVTLIALPQMQDRLQEIIVAARDRLAKGSLNTADILQLKIMLAQLKQSDLDRITADIQTVINEDPHFYGVSPTLQEKAPKTTTQIDAAIKNFISKIEALTADPNKKVDVNEFVKSSEEVLLLSHKVWNDYSSELDKLLEMRLSDLRASRWHSILISLFAIVFAISLSFYVGRGLNREIVLAFETLETSIAPLRETSESLLKTFRELASSAQEQAAGIQETAAGLTEINSMATKSSEAAGHSLKAADSSQEIVQNGQRSMKEMIHAIEEISTNNSLVMEEVQKNNEQMSEIAVLIGEIREKTKVIGDIVFQTKLLSFNASVEAARAGEKGKGFAVVAEDVGNLAELSGRAAKDISEIVGGSVEKVEKIVDETREKVRHLTNVSNKKIDDGSRMAHELDNSFAEVVNSVTETHSLASEISSASSEQAKGIDEITRAINLFDTIVQRNSSLTKSTETLAEGLNEQAESIEKVASSLAEIVYGGKTNK